MAIKDYYNTGDDNSAFYIDNFPTRYLAQTFTAGADYEIGSVKLKGFRTGSLGNLTIEIWATVAGLPAGGPLTSGIYDASALATAAPYPWFEVFVTPLALTSGQKYAIVLKNPASGRITWRVDAGGGYGGGNTCYSNNSGSDWTGLGSDAMFETWEAVVIPKTSSDSGGVRDVPAELRGGDIYIIPAGSNSRSATKGHADWNIAHDAGVADSILTNYTSPNFVQNAGSYLSAGLYHIYRCFYFFDTTGVPADFKIGEARIRMVIKNLYWSTVVFPNIYAVQGIQNDPVVVADYGTHKNQTTILGAGDAYNFVEGAYQDIILNPAGIAAINKGGETKLCLRGQVDLEDYLSGSLYSNWLQPHDIRKGLGFEPYLMLWENIFVARSKVIIIQ